MQPAPDASRGLVPTDHSLPLERLDLRTGGVKQKLHFLLDPIDLEALEANDLVPVVDCMTAGFR